MKIVKPLTIGLIAFCLLPLQALLAQVGREKLKEKNFDPASLPLFEAEMGTVKKKQVLATRFVHCAFVDARPDTNTVGFARFGNYQKFHRIDLPPSCASYLAQNYRPFFEPEAEAKDSLVLVLNRFWLSERYDNGNPDVTLSYCHIMADCYVRQGGLLKPIGAINVLERDGWIVHNYRPLMRDALVALLAKADTALRKLETIGIPVSWDFLQQQIANKFNQPIVKAPASKKGLFFTYADFINNQPAAVDFTIDEVRGREVVIAPTVDTSLTNHVWGYCDGSHHYIRLVKDFRKLTPIGNAFETLGPRTFKGIGVREDGTFATEVVVGTLDMNTNAFNFKISPSQLATGLLLSLMTASAGMSKYKELVPLQLDVSTGALY